MFRDTLSSLLICVVFLIWGVIGPHTKRDFLLFFVLTVPILIFSFLIRSILVVIELVVITVELISLFKEKKRKIAILIFLIISFAVCFIVFYFDAIAWYIDYYTSYLTSRTTGLSLYVYKIPFLPFGIIIRFILLLFSPVPTNLLIINNYRTDANSIFGVLNSAGTILQIFTIYYFAKSLVKRNKTAFYATVIMIFVTITFTFRHFILFYPFIFLSSVIAFQESSAIEKKRVLLLTSMILLLTVPLYIFFKQL